MVEIRRLHTTEPDYFFDGKHRGCVRKVEKLQYRYVFNIHRYYVGEDVHSEYEWSDWIDVEDVWEE